SGDEIMDVSQTSDESLRSQSLSANTPLPSPCVYRRHGDDWFATDLSRGPWSPDAQHGGAPCGLVVHLAESVFGDGWQLSRLTLDLLRPVPLGRLRASVETTTGRSTARALVSVHADEREVARATV